MKEKLLIFKDEDYTVKTTINILAILMIFGAIFGFVYETIFYRIDLGYFTKRGSTFGPWIPIYAFGSLFIILISYRYKSNPVLVFVLNCLVTGVLEYLTGWFLLKFLNIRLWDYNTEIWNFGNINGFVCLRSVLLFGISGLILVYFLIPLTKKIYNKVPEIISNIVIMALSTLFVLDIILYFLIK